MRMLGEKTSLTLPSILELLIDKKVTVFILTLLCGASQRFQIYFIFPVIHDLDSKG